jgi:membrane-associated protease RseP (regulator of RpoE activity)
MPNHTTLARRPGLVPALALLVLGSGSACPAQVPDAPADAAISVEVPFEMLPSNHMLVEVMLNDEGPYRLIFDLGSPVTLIGNRAARDAKVVDGRAPTSFLFAAKGEAEVESMRVGELTAEAVPVIVMDHPVVSALGKMLDKPIDGLVGHSFFARYKTTIDYQAKTMSFEPVEHEIRDFIRDLPDRMMGPKVARRIILEPAALFGIDLEDSADDRDGVRIASVVPGSPAEEAGLEPGDLLTSLDGRWTVDEADAFDAASKVRPGEPVELTVRRGEETRTLSLTPAVGF